MPVLSLPRFTKIGSTADSLINFVSSCLIWHVASRFVLVALLMMTAVRDTGPRFPSAPQMPAIQWFSSLVVAPVWETVVFQMIAVGLCKRFTSSRTAWYLAGTLPFALIHSIGGMAYFLITIPAGFWFSHCYIELAEKSPAHAGAATAVQHAASNLVFPWIAYFGSCLWRA